MKKLMSIIISILFALSMTGLCFAQAEKTTVPKDEKKVEEKAEKKAEKKKVKKAKKAKKAKKEVKEEKKEPVPTPDKK